MTNKNNITVLKVGTDTMINEQGLVRKNILSSILKILKEEIKSGRKILLVTSGAIKLGRKIIGDKMSRSATASIGQPILFNAYKEEADKLGINIAELLLSRPNLVNQSQFIKLKNTLDELFSADIMPIINESDVLVADTDWSFGDNDSLATTLAIMFGANLIVFATNVDGLFSGDPKKEKETKLIEEVLNLSDDFLKLCSKISSENGRGGMFSKLKSARLCVAVGIETRIVNGLKSENIQKALKREKAGTVFFTAKKISNLKDREKWILSARNSYGSIEIDYGAVEALKKGGSLLAVGVRKIYGQFDKKDIIEVVDPKRHGVAFGIIDYSNKEIEEMLKTQNTSDKQLIHANNLFMV